jgi:transcriptional regulator with XRE-family HTH domain
MDLSTKIQQLRKQKNFSQEQLAEALNISRQAISKWEAGQSVPELDNIIQLSELFHVSTDDLLKDSVEVLPGISAPLSHVEDKSPAQALLVIGTGGILFGLIVSLAIWIQWQTPLAIPVGIGVQLIALVILEVASRWHSDRNSFHRQFYTLNGWFLLPLPLIGLVSLAMHLFPRPYSRLALYAINISLYVLFGLIFRCFAKK